MSCKKRRNNWIHASFFIHMRDYVFKEWLVHGFQWKVCWVSVHIQTAHLKKTPNDFLKRVLLHHMLLSHKYRKCNLYISLTFKAGDLCVHGTWVFRSRGLEECFRFNTGWVWTVTAKNTKKNSNAFAMDVYGTGHCTGIHIKIHKSTSWFKDIATKITSTRLQE